MVIYRDRNRRLKKQHKKLFRVKHTLKQLRSDVQNQQRQHEALELQTHADRGDMKPIYNYIKAIRGKKVNGPDKAIMIHDTHGNVPETIEQENNIWTEFIKKTMQRQNESLADYIFSPPITCVTQTQWNTLKFDEENVDDIPNELIQIRKDSKLYKFFAKYLLK